jgi:glycosyltransferase involved in cell wall biosynthesis
MAIKISVVIPTYKRPDLLIKCLDALVVQNFEWNEFEIIVVSDGPDEATGDVLRAWHALNPLQFKYLHLPQKKGPAAARNYGWRNAKGDLIAFTDDDCIPAENWLQAFYSSWCPGTSIAFTGKTIVPIPDRPSDYERNTANLQTADFITANCCCSRNALELTGGFDEQFSMAWREDSDLEFRLYQQQIVIRKIDDATVVHPVRKAPWGISIKEQKKTMFNVLLYKKYPLLYRKKIQPTPPLNYYLTIFFFIVMVIGLFSKQPLPGFSGGVLWLLLTLIFVFRRLRYSSLTFNTITDMTVTSFIIPFLSIYWQYYGVVKYKALLI